jgi:hypothetical protein
MRKKIYLDILGVLFLTILYFSKIIKIPNGLFYLLLICLIIRLVNTFFNSPKIEKI